MSKRRIFLHVKGFVQGVGFRPFIYKIAKEIGLCGHVLNSSNGVEIQIQGEEKKLSKFIEKLQNPPPLCKIDSIEKKIIKTNNQTDFIIKKSVDFDVKNALVLPDFTICKDCLKELNDPKNRRFNYPFINCTNCGPRYSIIKNIPYDRSKTSMAKFKMCDRCKKEYENPLDRRYHAEPISCKDCGLVLSFYEKNMLISKYDEAIKRCAKLIQNGEILAIKGVGGFHLVCDSLNDETIKKLRIFKNRPFKPFAVMCKNITQASLHVKMTKYEKQALKSMQKPIVLVKSKNTLSKQIAPQTDKLGIFLPNTPLHVILFKYLKNPIILTSANIQNEPIITKKEDIDENFDFIYGILDHNREILHSCDDSVLQFFDDKKIFLRISRGFSPLVFSQTNDNEKTILAVGAEQKNQIAIYFDKKIILSPYLGDMNNVKTYELFLKTISDWKKFYNLNFDMIICDKHPNYTTSKWAREQKNNILHVNHHHAHILATLIDQNIPLNKEVLGIAWDGTGYGDDGNICGGEFLICKGKKYKNIARFKSFKLLGGEKSIKNINRIAYSMLLDIDKNLNLSEFDDIKFLKSMHQKDINSPKCSSVGRLFDAVCYLCTGLEKMSYDGQSGLILESLYDKKIKSSYDLIIEENFIISYEKMLLCILKERKNPVLVASKFLNSLADIVEKFANIYNLPLVLSGGVFQNKTLLEILHVRKISFYFPQKISPNDGSICIGQIAYELAK